MTLTPAQERAMTRFQDDLWQFLPEVKTTTLYALERKRLVQFNDQTRMWRLTQAGQQWKDER